MDIIVILEMRQNPTRLERTFQLLGFDGFVFIELFGFACGIIMAWKTEKVDIQVILKNFQFMQLFIDAKDDHKWIFTPSFWRLAYGRIFQ